MRLLDLHYIWEWQFRNRSDRLILANDDAGDTCQQKIIAYTHTNISYVINHAPHRRVFTVYEFRLHKLKAAKKRGKIKTNYKHSQKQIIQTKYRWVDRLFSMQQRRDCGFNVWKYICVYAHGTSEVYVSIVVRMRQCGVARIDYRETASTMTQRMMDHA